MSSWRCRTGQCQDCSDNNKLGLTYMVWDRVWFSAGFPTKEGLCCLLCLEQRLTRPLTIRDFTFAPINRGVLARLTRLRRGITDADSTAMWAETRRLSFEFVNKEG
jgi:hypothetical protein